MDPLGNVPVFLALTATDDLRTRRRTATHALAAATIIIYAFAFFGTQILAALSIGLPALQAGGGVVLFLVALEMLRGDILLPNTSEGVNVAIVPLGVPLLAGPGSISAAMVFMSSASGRTGALQLGTQISVALAIAAVLAVLWLVLRYANVIERLLKANGIHLVTRVMGMLLIAISIELVATAVQAYVAGASALP
ncbi:MarC family protein [Nitriliruptoraceae bacterium ZYF776]|nr:MarC family protein [Profundirhabdus halotolerans]